MNQGRQARPLSALRTAPIGWGRSQTEPWLAEKLLRTAMIGWSPQDPGNLECPGEIFVRSRNQFVAQHKDAIN